MTNNPFHSKRPSNLSSSLTSDYITRQATASRPYRLLNDRMIVENCSDLLADKCTRYAFYFYTEENKTINDIATKLGMTRDHVRGLLNQASNTILKDHPQNAYVKELKHRVNAGEISIYGQI